MAGEGRRVKGSPPTTAVRHLCSPDVAHTASLAVRKHHFLNLVDLGNSGIVLQLPPLHKTA